jgi:16S rRNA (cytosine967-C5)-methyltransferase
MMVAADALPDSGGLDGRGTAYQAVLAVLQGRGFAGEVIRALRTQQGLSPREAGFAMDLALGTVRHVITLDHVLETVGRVDRRRTRPELRAILYIAAYQIIWMDRVPVFAAVDQAVKQAHRYVGGRAPGMANAVLRNLTRTLAIRETTWERLNPAQIRTSWRDAAAFTRPVLPDPAELELHLAAASGERLSRYRTLIARFGPDAAEQVAWASQAVPVTILQRNRLRISTDEFQQRMQALAIEAGGEQGGPEAESGASTPSGQKQIELTPDAAFLPAAAHVPEIPLFAEGLALVQDPTAHSAALLLEAWPGERVLDLCAAPGGKSAVLAIEMDNRGEVVACDSSPERLTLVEDNRSRLGLTCIKPYPAPTGEHDDLGEFDAALVDVPCSNTGVVARRPEARLGFSREKLDSLVKAQRELITTAANHVHPGGRLVYSTCSIEPEENQDLIAWFVTHHPEWLLDQEQSTLPAWGPRLADWRDGGYAARLTRKT